MKGLTGVIHTSFFSWLHSSFTDGKLKLKGFKLHGKKSVGDFCILTLTSKFRKVNPAPVKLIPTNIKCSPQKARIHFYLSHTTIHLRRVRLNNLWTPSQV